MMRLPKLTSLAHLCVLPSSFRSSTAHGRLILLRARHSSSDHGLLPHVTRESLPELISDVNHYLRTTEMASNLRQKLLSAKCGELLVYGRQKGVSVEYFRIFNRVLVQTRKEMDKVLTPDQLHELFNSAVDFYLAKNESVPQFVHLLAANFVKKKNDLPTMTLANIVRLGGVLRDFKTSLLQVTRQSLPTDFIAVLLSEMKKNNELDLAAFEAILDSNCVNDDLARAFVQYVEDLFHENNPRIHEYVDHERNMYRLQEHANQLVSFKYSTEVDVELLSFKVSMNSVVCSAQDIEKVDMIFGRIASSKDLVLKEETSEVVLLESVRKSHSHPEFLRYICSQIESGEFSEQTKAKARIAELVAENSTPREDILEALKKHEQVFTFAVQALSKIDSKMAETVEFLREELHRIYSLDEYKYLIEFKTQQNPEEAFQIFSESAKTINWQDSLDPSVAYTLNKLILALAKDTSISLDELFGKFKIIKQHHPKVCDADTLSALSERMLNEQCVGDVIEMMKRELPKIDKDSIPKIILEESYCQAHSRLFQILHNFVLTYEQDETYETNWVLYGELHKYFQVPHNTYLPTMQFFCSKNRLNASLLICRRMKMLSELHGKQNANLPPSRDIYMYLFEEFGDKLYDEGVTEVHEFLKMDTSMETQDIELQNCLLNAYSNLQEVGKANDLFLSISANPKLSGGINERTAQIMIKTLTYTDMAYVRQFWNRLSEYGVFPNADIFKQYLIAHSYHGLVGQAIELAASADEYNITFSPEMMLAMHNYCLDAGKQDEVAAWAQETHPEEWCSLKKRGLLKTASEYVQDELLPGTEEN